MDEGTVERTASFPEVVPEIFLMGSRQGRKREFMKPENLLIINQTDEFSKDMMQKGCNVRKAYIYNDKGRIQNLIRRMWVKLRLPCQSIWYNKSLINVDKEAVLIYEPLITHDFVKWIGKKNPNTRIVFLYMNIVRTTISPEPIKKYADVYTWDKKDAETYHLNFYKGTYWKRSYPDYSKEYDVVFIGRDKGRLGELLDIETRLKEKGLKTFFYIVGDNNVKKYNGRYKYKKSISYEKLMEYTLKSRAVLDLVQYGQVGTTLRTMESIFYGIKLFTNNKELKSYDFYDKNNFFILGEDDWSDVVDFVCSDFHKVSDDILEEYTFDALIRNL